MLNKLPPIHIHPILIFFIVISFVTGTFLELMTIFSIVFIHEMGHYGMAKLFKWRIRRVMLWVFGGVMETEEHGSRPVKEEILVTLAGPIQHLFIYLGLFILSDAGILQDPVLQKALFYNITILIFNLLPIWPLDGGKLLFLVLTKLISFRKALDVIFIFSLLMCAGLLIGHFFFLPFTLTFALLMIFLFLENRLEWKRRIFIFIRFLMGRYQGKHSVKKFEPLYLTGDLTLMEVFSRFKREKKHMIIIEGGQNAAKRIDESECLHAYFYHKRYNEQISELF